MTLYLDMDGVIADFFGALANQYKVDHWKSIQDRDRIFVEMRNTNFFATIPEFYAETIFGDQGDGIYQRSLAIIDKVKEIAGDDWGICSSPLRNDEHNSAYWKREWLRCRDWLPPKLENLIFTSHKHKYAYNPVTRKPNILVDDKPENIKAWNDAGGIGILFQNNQDDLKEYLFVEMEKAWESVKY